MKQSKTPLLEHHSFFRGPANIVISDRDLAALNTLAALGGHVSGPADLGEALNRNLDGTRKAMLGGRHLSRLQTAGFVRNLEKPAVGYEITAEGRDALARAVTPR